MATSTFGTFVEHFFIPSALSNTENSTVSGERTVHSAGVYGIDVENMKFVCSVIRTLERHTDRSDGPHWPKNRHISQSITLHNFL